MNSETVYLIWTDEGSHHLSRSADGDYYVYEHIYFTRGEAEDKVEELRDEYYSDYPDIKIVVKEHTLKGPKDD